MSKSQLSRLLEAAEKRRHEAIREKLALPASARIEGLELESLAYHLTERDGEAQLRLVDGTLWVSEPGAPTGLRYRGDAMRFALQAWGVSEEEASRGCVIRLRKGARIG